MIDFLLVQTSSNSKDGAQKIADTLIEKRLAAVCWISGPVSSTFWWEGRIEQEQEWVCSIKTRYALYNDLERAIRAVHTYKVPEIIAIPIVAASQSFLEWVSKETEQR